MKNMARKRTASPVAGNPWPEVLYELRVICGWEQKDAADEVEVHHVTWAKWETGKIVPRAIAKYALKCLIRRKVPKLLEKIDK